VGEGGAIEGSTETVIDRCFSVQILVEHKSKYFVIMQNVVALF
jgi:hypothetical protein